MNRAVVALCALALMASACNTKAGGDGARDGKVTYSVTGSGGVKKADMTYTDGSTQTTQATGAKLPWKKTVKAAADSVLLYQVSAQNSSGAKGKVTCTITLDGKVVKMNTSSGAGAIASCEYTPR